MFVASRTWYLLHTYIAWSPDNQHRATDAFEQS